MNDGMLKDVGEVVGDVVDDVKTFLTSEQGRVLRHNVATGLITMAPIIAALPPIRASKIGRLVGFTGAAALIVKIGEIIRDWEPERAQSPTWQN